MISSILDVLAAIVILGFIIMAHEFGHYIVARSTGIGVLEFSVGFGPKLLGWKRKGIQYSLRAIPLGGFCKFAGMEDGEAERPDAMEKQPVWKRFLTVASGPLMNFILAFVFVWIILAVVGLEVIESVPVVGTISENMPAQECGLQVGDVFIEIQGEEISRNIDGVYKMQELVKEAGETEISFKIQRGEEILEMTITPRLSDDGETQRPMIGIVFGTEKTGMYHYPPIKALGESWNYIVRFTKLMLEALRNMIFKGEGLDQVTGPVGTISMMSAQVRQGWGMICNLIFVLSLNLGIMNLLPIPGLDGARLVFLIVEGIRRKPVPPEKEGLVHAIGFIALLVLTVFITYKDIVRLIAG